MGQTRIPILMLVRTKDELTVIRDSPAYGEEGRVGQTGFEADFEACEVVSSYRVEAIVGRYYMRLAIKT